VDLQSLIFDMFASFPEKNQEIIKRRFGLLAESGETLEAIGKDYGVTRERVRQIEALTLKTFKQEKGTQELKVVEEMIISVLVDMGGVTGERELLAKLLGDDFRNPVYCNLILFVLKISDRFFLLPENDHYRQAWTTERGFFKKTEGVIELAKEVLAKVGEPLTIDELQKAIDVSKIPSSLNDKMVRSYLALSKEVIPNPYGDWGLSDWNEINPRGVKDRAYIVLKKSEKPLHFTQITEAINRSGLGTKPAHAPTVHNELIKDSRFVLVGRGIYALRSWGYKKGTVKEVLVDVLKKQDQPVKREELINLVLKQRIVRRSTVLLNLQDDSLFLQSWRNEISLK